MKTPKRNRKILAALATLLVSASIAIAQENPVAVIVLTNHSQLGDTGKETGAYLSEVTHPYDVFAEAGYEVILASPKGGKAPIDPKATSGPINEKFLAKESFQKQLANTAKLAEVDLSKVDILFFAGGHGTMWDFPDSEAVQDAAREVYEGGSVVAAVCHGPAALVNVMKSDGGYLLAGKQVAGFTNAEEEAVGLTEVMPFLLEDKMVERGAVFTRVKNFQSNVVADGRLVTGQNPSSAKGVATASIAAAETTSESAE